MGYYHTPLPGFIQTLQCISLVLFWVSAIFFVPIRAKLEDGQMAKGKNKKAHKLRWRKKKANHGNIPCKGR
jgi:hypothetical protein